MKKMRILASFTVLFLFTSSFYSAHAVNAEFATCWEREDADYTLWRKGGRGLSNLALGWLEVFYQPVHMREQGNRLPIAITGGVLEGLYFTVVRTVAGAVETVTFPLPVPWGYRPLLHPEFPIPPNCEQELLD